MKKLFLLTALTAGLTLALISTARAETYGGDATAAQVTVPATGTTIRAATGTLSISGGGEEASLLVGDIPSNLTGGAVALAAGVLHSSIVGVGSLTVAESSMGDVNLTISGNQITTDFLMARSRSRCQLGPHEDGDSQAENLVVNGQPITVTGAPNQTITLSNGTVIINEQVSSIVGNTGELRVNALHVTTHDVVTGAQLADVLLATVDSKQGCEEEPHSTEIFVKGGGEIPGALGGAAKFGVHAKSQGVGTWKGHVVYKDPGANFSMQSTSITDVIAGTGCQVTIKGNADSNQGSVRFEVTVQDNGEPGTLDTFQITVWPANAPPNATPIYSNGPFPLSRGNIEVESPTCPDS